MGLGAAVYRRLEELPFTTDQLRFVSVDSRTGQVDFEDANLFKAWSKKVTAAEKRLGNIALIAYLRVEVEGALGSLAPNTLLMSAVLYSGIHCGDFIPRDSVSTLRREILLVRERAGGQATPELRKFLTDLEELTEAAEKHGNPIVFI